MTAMRNIPLFILLSFLTDLVLAEPAPQACSVREMNDAWYSSDENILLAATGTIQHIGQYRRCTIEDETGRTLIKIPETIALPEVGTRVAVTCIKTITPGPDYDRWLIVRSMTVLGKGEITKPLELRLNEIDERKHDLYDIVTEGIVMDILSDEIDARYNILLLKDGASYLPVFMKSNPENAQFLGARVSVSGIYHRLVSGLRRFSGPFMMVDKASIKIINPPIDAFKAPELNIRCYLTPKEVSAMDRRTMKGVVLAVWNQDSIMLQIGKLYANIQLKERNNLPPVGSRIMVSGYPEVDLYKINLTKADWILLSDAKSDSLQSDRPPDIISISKITGRKSEEGMINYFYHGHLVRIRGVVCSRPTEESEKRRILIDSDSEQIAVDLSSCPEVISELLIGCEIEVVGRCLMEVSAWSAYRIFPQILGLTILTRSCDDVKILRRPSWWTSRRLVIVITILVATLVIVIIWNRFLSRLVERRGRELFSAEIARASEALRVQERTRLAVELHDSLSQNLTGIAMQIRSGRHDLAERTLRACREELKNCIWDLRNNTIDCDGMDESILRTIAPQIENIQCTIRFNVSRKDLSDNTAYTILRIIRELVTNAMRHGLAKNVFIAGSRDADRLLFSVRDDGIGFDLAEVPGIAEGHFGLQGVKERVAALGGTIAIKSKINCGTKITVSIPLSVHHT